MGTLKVDDVIARTGNAMNLGVSGDTVTVPTGASLVVTDGLAISSLPTVTVAKGGTGATSASAARTALGLALGSDVQAYNAGTKIAGKETIWVPAVAMYPNTTGGCADIAQVELSNGPEIKY